MVAQQDIPSDCEIQVVIKFLNVEKVNGVEIHGRLCAIYGADKVMSKRHVYKWITCFDERRMETHDKPRSGRPSDGVNDETIACVHTF